MGLANRYRASFCDAEPDRGGADTCWDMLSTEGSFHNV